MVRDLSQATFEAYDGVRLRLATGYVIETRPFTVAEAVHFLRLIDEATEQPGAHSRFFAEFPERMGITTAKLADLGLEVPGLSVGDLKYPAAAALENLLADATGAENLSVRSKAQRRFLEAFTQAFGLADDMRPADVFALGHKFVEAFYLLIYGLARGFCYHLIPGPGNQVGMARAGSSSTLASTT